MLLGLAFVVATSTSVGVNVHLPPSDTLDLADELGTGWVRIDFNWDVGEPSNGSYDWAPFDAVIDAAEARGQAVFATIGYTPAWASTGDRMGDGPGNDVPVTAEYQQFVQDAAARYGTRVAAWGTWNEPNLGGFFEGSMAEWLVVFNAAIDGVQAGCPACLVAGPEVASIGDQYDDYLQAALAARGADLDAVTFHIYAAFPEDDSDAGVGKDSFYNKLDTHRVIVIGGITVYEGPLSAHEVMSAEGYAGKPLWITETGREAANGNATQEEDQRLYVQRVLDAMATRSYWERTVFYELSEEHPGGMWPGIEWGLALRIADPDGTYADNWDRKAAFDYLRMRLAAAPPVIDAGVPGTPDAAPAETPDADPTAPDAPPAAAADASGTGPGSGSGSGCGCRSGSGSGSGSGLFLTLLATFWGLRTRVRGRKAPISCTANTAGP